MPEQSAIVWDLETVPDLAAAARMLDMPHATEAELREALGPGFPKLPLHKIACIGALVASRKAEGWQVDALGAPHIGERPEDRLITDFIERIGQLRPQLITFNGHSFDLPVLRYRAMVNRISALGLQVRPYFHRYTEDALDLCDVLGSYVPGAKVKLSDVSKILGLGGKPEGIDGSRVEEMVLSGQIEEVSRYCESDVMNTYRMWLVYELFTRSDYNRPTSMEREATQRFRPSPQANKCAPKRGARHSDKWSPLAVRAIPYSLSIIHLVQCR